MPTLTNDQLAALARTGALNKEIEATLGRAMNLGEAAIVNRARVVWRLQRAAKQKERSDAGADAPSNWRKECERLKAALMELELAKERGDSVERADVQRVAQEDAAAIKTAMLGMPNALAPQLLGMKSPEQVRAILDDWARSTLSGWAAAARGEIRAALSANTNTNTNTNKRGKK